MCFVCLFIDEAPLMSDWAGCSVRHGPPCFRAEYVTSAVALHACYGHTIQNNPVLVRSRKATWIGPDQYYVG